jgi:cytidylate kinase
MTHLTGSNAPFSVVALDGGAASGKSSTARLLAQRRGLCHVDTGSHYRGLTLALARAGVATESGPGLREFLARLRLASSMEGNQSHLKINGEVPSPAKLRGPEVNVSVSAYAALPEVREALKTFQREEVGRARHAGYRGIVMEGRDIGTVILPDADLKIFLTADPAKRRLRREEEGGGDRIEDRDRADSGRRSAPLRPAADAIVIDNSSIGLEAVVQRIESLLDETVSRP